MSFTVSITGNDSFLTTYYSPPLQLDGEYECGLLYFSSFNSIPNIDDTNNMFHYGENDNVKIPEGSYELEDINDFLKRNVKDCDLKLTCNNNTLTTKLFCSKDIHFNKSNSIGAILGFGNEILRSNKWHESRFPISILPTTIVRIECDIVSGSFVNGIPSHIIYEFAPNVPPGYRIIEIPKNIIYFPVNHNSVSNITVKILDGANKLVNLRKEEIQLYMHIKKK